MKLSLKVSRSRLIAMGGLLAEAMSELLGTFFLLLIIFLSPVMVSSVEPFILGTSLIALMLAFGAFSKPHLNPLFSFAEYFTYIPEQIAKRKFSVDKLWELLMYLIAQFIGGITAFALAMRLQDYLINMQIEINGLTGTEGIRDQFLGQLQYTTTYLGQFSTTVFAIEMLFSFMLAFVYLATMVKNKNLGQMATSVGLMVFSFTVFAANFTGASFHPFRSLVPALFTGGEALSQVWVYLLAPVAGALFAALAYLLLEWLRKLKKTK